MQARRGIAALVGAVLVSVATPLHADPVQLADGDSFSLGRQRYRLYGIDAPELHQECKDAAGRAWACGIRARSELRRVIGSHPVECRIVSTDRFGRIVATCHAGGRDLAEAMVRAGYATISVRHGFTNPYESALAEARADKRGIWAGSFDMPRDWRRANPRNEAPPVQETPRDWLVRKSAQAWQSVRAWTRSVLGW